MANRTNFKERRNNNQKKNDLSKKPMNIINKEELDDEFEDRIIDYCTFYRRNIHRFIEHYFDIKLHFYQIIIIYLMNLCPLVVLICARAVSKSFITALYACAICCLYPNSKVLVTAFTKKQGGLLITEKVQKELMMMSSNLKREIEKISTSQNCIEVTFKNGSSFIASVASESARGLRSTILIVDEFRLVDKDIVDSILSPTEIIRPTPYTKKHEYSHLQEEPREIFLSSAHMKSNWMWGLIKQATVGMYKGEAICFGTDYALTLKHGIRTKKQMLREKKKLDSTTFDMEYNNLMLGGSDRQYFSYELVSACQKLKRAWYPKTQIEYAENKRNRIWDIPKQSGEIRVVGLDVALAASTKRVKNDNSVIKCVRALVNGENYERQEVYIESFEGKDSTTQAVRVRQIMEDFQGDYLVLDCLGAGLNVLDDLGKVLYDEERDKEYIPIKCFNNTDLAARCKNVNALPVVYGMRANADINHEMHMGMNSALTKGKLKFLISNLNCREQFLDKKKEYELASPEEKARLEIPYLQSDFTLNEMINLETEYIGGTKIKLVEPSTGTKDRYITSGYINYFIDTLERNLSEEENDHEGQLVFF